MKKILGFLTLVLTSFLVACGTTGNANEDVVTVRLGVTASDITHWEHVRTQLLNDNINLEIIQFTDWVTPNTALAFGDIDLNSFQTHTFLENFNEENNENLSIIGETIIMPMGIYSVNHISLDTVPYGATFSIPNDPTNGARGLLLLQTVGLIEVDDAAGYVPLLSDITHNPLNLNIIELEAQQLPRAIQDVDFAVINAIIALEAGIHPNYDALVLEPLGVASPFNNVIAARGEDANDPVLLAVVAAFQTEDVAKIIAEVFDNTQFPVW